MGSTDATTDPVAVGYIRALRPDSARLDAVAERLVEYGARMGYAVRTVYRDDGSDAANAHQSGFLALMEEVRNSDAQAVIVPSPAHLSLLPDVRRWMAHMLAHAGAQLVVMPELAVGVASVETLPSPRCVADVP
jgi:hypothetical protein